MSLPPGPPTPALRLAEHAAATVAGLLTILRDVMRSRRWWGCVVSDRLH